jgi:hypothetical protein
VTSNRNTKAGLSLVPAPTVTWSRCSDRYDYLCCSMNLGYVLCASRPVPVPSDRGLRWLGMGKVHGDEVSQGLVPCERQLLNRGRCRHRWIVQDGIGIIDSTCVRESSQHWNCAGWVLFCWSCLSELRIWMWLYTTKCLTIICCDSQGFQFRYSKIFGKHRNYWILVNFFRD